MILSSKQKTQGFTLIELVIVIIVLAVLAASAIPKFSNRSGFEDYALRDQMIARLRLVQLQGMNADPTEGGTQNACYWLVVKNNCFYNEHSIKTGAICDAPSASDVCNNEDYNDFGRVKFPTGMLTTRDYRFDLNGKLLPDNGVEEVIGINGDNNLFITIESEGFIHEQ